MTEEMTVKHGAGDLQVTIETTYKKEKEPTLLPCGDEGCRNPHEKAYRGCDICKYNKTIKEGNK